LREAKETNARRESVRVILEELTLGFEGESDEEGGEDVMDVLHTHTKPTETLDQQGRSRKRGG
jgi:hypothetical protein